MSPETPIINLHDHFGASHGNLLSSLHPFCNVKKQPNCNYKTACELCDGVALPFHDSPGGAERRSPLTRTHKQLIYAASS